MTAPTTTQAQPVAGSETLIRYCPGCGSVGTVEGNYRDCCPDGGRARMIPEPLAKQCRDTFRLAINAVCASPQPVIAPDQADFGPESDTPEKWAAVKAWSEKPVIAPIESKRGTDAQILFERQLTCETIQGAMAFGYQGAAYPPDEAAWLRPFYDIGKQQAAAEAIMAQPAPAPWVMLDDDELNDLWENTPDCAHVANYDDQRKYAKVVLAAFIAKQGAAHHDRHI